MKTSKTNISTPAPTGLDDQQLGRALRQALLCEIDQAELPADLSNALHAAARMGLAAAITLVAWREERLFETIAALEADHGSH